MIREAINTEMISRGDNPSKLAKAIGVHKPTIYNFINSKAGLRFDVLEKVFKHYDLKVMKDY